MTTITNKFKFVVMLWVALAVSTLFSIQAVAQCQTCKPSERVPNALVCKSASSGGQECQAAGDTCALAGICRGNIPPIEDPDIYRFAIEPTLIKQIGEVHPRFAFALATLLKNGMLSDGVKIYIVPKEITMTGVEERLTSNQSKNLPLEINTAPLPRKGKSLELKKFSPVIYEISLGENSKLTLKVVQGTPLDPSYSRLEIDLVEVDGLNSEEKRIKAVSWRVQ